jgi:DNA-binding IclR family transcriptional regulator
LQIECTSVRPLSQQEIASRVLGGKSKVNRIIEELIEGGYVEMVHTKEHYFIATKWYELLEKMFLYEN